MFDSLVAKNELERVHRLDIRFAQLCLTWVERIAALASHPDDLARLRRNPSTNRMMARRRRYFIHGELYVHEDELQYDIALKVRNDGKSRHVYAPFAFDLKQPA